MNILHVVFHSLVRFTPARIAAMWGRYTEHNGKAVALYHEGDFSEFLNPYGFKCFQGVPRKKIIPYLEWADVIHCHDDFYPANFLTDHRFKNIDYSKKILVYHAHIGSIPQQFFCPPARFKYDNRVIHASITNGYGHLFDEDEKNYKRKWHRLPDVLDLNHPTFRPISIRKEGKLIVSYTYSNHHEGGKINSKRPKAHRKLISGIPGIKFCMLFRRPFEESMALKKASDIVIDELFSPYMHLSSLEGAAVGAMVITNYNEATRKELCDCVGSPIEEFPFFRATKDNIVEVLSGISRDKVRFWGSLARNWMEKYYRPELLLRKYLDLYGQGTN